MFERVSQLCDSPLRRGGVGGRGAALGDVVKWAHFNTLLHVIAKMIDGTDLILNRLDNDQCVGR